MPIPNYGAKPDAAAFMTPADRLDRRFPDGDRPRVPPAIILTLQDDLFDHVAQRPDAESITLDTPVYTGYELNATDGAVGVVGDFGVGAPTLGIVLEELLELGASHAVIVGGCGTLQPTVDPGDLIVVDQAIRDEGTSYHYLDPDTTATADPQLRDALATHAEANGLTAHVGPSWTTDGFYRETTAEIEAYRSDGVLTVDMEAAALFAIAAYRNAAAGVVLTPFDRLTGDDWDWDLPGTTRRDRLVESFDVAVETLVDHR